MLDSMELWSILLWATIILTTITARVPVDQTRHSNRKYFQHPTTFEIDGIHYVTNTGEHEYTISVGKHSIRTTNDHTSKKLATVLAFNVSTITAEDVEAKIDQYLAEDDVFNRDFLTITYITSTVSGARLTRPAIDFLTTLGAEQILIERTRTPILRVPFTTTQETLTNVEPSANDIPPGPYSATATDGVLTLAKVYRLYPDTYRTFLYGTYPGQYGRHHALSRSFPDLGTAAIPVPSRLYTLNDPRPLAGVRVGIKDSFAMRGLKTSAGSRAWTQIQAPAPETAPAIQRLLDRGAVLVGKQKLAQFSSGAQAWEWEDEQYPFNPRGDGWLSCSASSSGGACSVAAYDWLDVAVGSDTGGSIRMPAALAGVYGNRPSQGAVSLEGMMPIGHATDTAGVFARDPVLWSRFTKAWYEADLHETVEINGLPPLSMRSDSGYPKTLLWPDEYFAVPHAGARDLVDRFVGEFSRLFGTRTTHFNFTSTVLNAPDSVAADLKGRLSDVFILNSQHSFEQIYKPFLTTWRDEHGRMPPTDPDFRKRIPHLLDRIDNENSAERTQAYDAAIDRKRRAVEWFNTELFPSSADTCSDNIMIYDIGSNGLPSYREKHLNVDPAVSADTSYLRPLPPGVLTIPASICSVFACADYTLTIGQVEYFSQVTHKMELLPVTINLVVKRGCDFMLFDMIEKMAEWGILETVKAGQTAF